MDDEKIFHFTVLLKAEERLEEYLTDWCSAGEHEYNAKPRTVYLRHKVGYVLQVLQVGISSTTATSSDE